LAGYDIPEAVITFRAGGQLKEGDTLKIKFTGSPRPLPDQIKHITKAQAAEG